MKWRDIAVFQNTVFPEVLISLYDSRSKLSGSRATSSLDICVNLYAISGIRWLQHWPTISGAWVSELLFDESNQLLVFITTDLSGSNPEDSCSGGSFIPWPCMPQDLRKSKTQVNLFILYIHHFSKHLSPTSHFVGCSEILVFVNYNWLIQRWKVSLTTALFLQFQGMSKAH